MHCENEGDVLMLLWSCKAQAHRNMFLHNFIQAMLDKKDIEKVIIKHDISIFFEIQIDMEHLLIDICM